MKQGARNRHKSNILMSAELSSSKRKTYKSKRRLYVQRFAINFVLNMTSCWECFAITSPLMSRLYVDRRRRRYAVAPIVFVLQMRLVRCCFNGVRGYMMAKVAQNNKVCLWLCKHIVYSVRSVNFRISYT